ncbi:KR domain protein [Ilyonectria destructans]|nr:KR domain protein [Ilyonectria destructans]
MSTEFEGKVVLVTGGTGGIGYACASMLASRGASVALLDIGKGIDQASRITKEFGRPALAIECDVTRPEDVESAVNTVIDEFGRLDLCVNAAGILPPGGNVDVFEPSMWARVINVNLNGVFHCVQQEIKAFKRLEIRGSIVNFSSDAGTVATAGCAAYVASKHAVNGLTKTAALECASQGIRVNAVAPGNIETPMIAALGVSMDEIARALQPTGRCGKPEEVAELVCFLLSDRSAFMTGSIVAIDGGITTTGYSSSNNTPYGGK